MSDPRRWREERSGATELLLRGARRPQLPDAADMERLGAAVDQISRVPVRGQPSWLRLAVAGAVAFAIAGGGTFVWALHARDVQRRAEEAAALEAMERTTARAPKTTSAPSPVAEAAPTRPTPARPRRHVAEPKVAVAAPAPVVDMAKATDSLAREVPLIDEGRAALATAPSRALAVLETHRREFPRGQLAAEREFLAVQALLQMNHTADAKKRAEELGVHYPSSSYAARAARLIEDAEAQRAAVPTRDGSRGGLQRVQDRL
jgi:hypothetical protein